MTDTAKKRSAHGPAIIAVFVALLVAVQYVLSFLPGVELVTVTFVAFCCVFGARYGMITATCFAVLRQFVFGFFPPVLLLYLVYFNLLALVMGKLGARAKPNLAKVVIIAIVSTLCFTLLDNVITPLWFGYSWNAFWIYFKASLVFVGIQCACAGVTTGLLFNPLHKVFSKFKR